MLEHLLRYIIDHNEVVIQWLVVTVLGLSVVVMALSIFGSRGSDEKDSFRTIDRPGRDEASAAAAAAGTGGGVAAASATAAAGGPSAPELAQQVLVLQQELSQRNQEVEKLKAAPPPATSTAELDQHLKKIKELEAKLAEYEILEDDIADLSLYKDENARLKEQLEKLKSGAPAEAAPTAAPSAPAEAAEGAPASAPAANPVAAAGDELVAEFASAVEAGKKADFPIVKTEEPIPTSETPAEPAPAAKVAVTTAKEPTTAPEKDGDDLLTEFASPPAEPVSEGLDTDKMLAEVASLPDAADAGSSLEGETDMDKMAAEATKLLASD